MLKFAGAAKQAVPVHFVTAQTAPALRAELSAAQARFWDSLDFSASPGRHLLLPGAGGGLGAVVFALEDKKARRPDPFLPASLVGLLPPGDYRFVNDPHDPAAAALAWLLGSYRFSAYKKTAARLPRLVAPKGVDARRIEIIAAGVAMTRDLVNTPANDLGPAGLEAAALRLARAFGAKVKVIRGADLLKQNFPLIHAVGRASASAPRLVDFTWGPPRAPKVTLVGKGVCFDTGGLDIKPSSSMLLMKKDMGGAATALGLAQMIMAAKLKVRLRVLLPIVENSISSDAFRPSDIFPSRKGLSVEIGNTDAEGRLILADALTLADDEAPELLFDFATLTGAARVALGPELPPFYTGSDALARDIARHGEAVNDPVWRMPLWNPYDRWLDGKISDLNSAPGGGFAGSITAALFLRRFVEKTVNWAHFDIYAWTPAARPGRPEGGESQSARLLFDLLSARYGA